MGNSIEPLNYQTSMAQRLSYTSINENTIFFVEQADDPKQKSQWQLFFEQENSKSVIRFNTPSDNYQQVTVFDNKIAIHSSKTLEELKTLISKKLQVPESELILKKALNAVELKDLSQTIKEGLLPNSNIVVVKGTPLTLNQIRVSVLLAVPNEALIKDGEFFKFFPLLETPVDLDINIKEFKEILVLLIRQRYPSLIINHCRLREIQTDKLSR